jgi:hypothetical protein
MMLSFNEIESLASKSARGAGFAWGLAEEVAAAAGWLARAGIPWPCSLSALLLDLPRLAPPETGGPVLVAADAGAALCPIRAGLLVAEADLLLEAESARLTAVAHSVWLLPFMARAARHRNRTIRLRVGTAMVLVGPAPGDQRGGGRLAEVPTPMEVEISAVDAPKMPGDRLPPFVAVPADQLSPLERLERRTYVPASDASRISGAGAGLSDND